MLSRREFIRTSQLLAAAACIGVPRSVYSKPESEGRPNVILFTADDLGPQLGCYGDRDAVTPNLDKLASEGVRFTTAYVTQSSCSPSRSSILTGLYPHQNGQVGLSHHNYSMNKAYPSIPSILKNAGYKTAIFGKLHIEPKSAFDFDFSCLDHKLNITDRDVKELTGIAEGFITDAQDSPFFMMFNAIDPHRPFSDQLSGIPEKPLTADDVSAMPFLGIDNEALRKDTAAYHNSVTRADYALGALVAALRKIGKYENTLIIAIGDNGPPFTRGKTTCYEAGLRTPFIAAWGQNLPRGCVRNELVSTVDILPTILDAAGVELPADLPGRSLIPLIKDNIPWRQYLCGEYTTHSRNAYFPRRAVRDKRYKLIRNYRDTGNPLSGVDGCPAYNMVMRSDDVPEHIKDAYKTYKSPPQYEFYDLDADPYEFRNLIAVAGYQSHIERLNNALQQWQKDTSDDNPDYEDHLPADENAELTKETKI